MEEARREADEIIRELRKMQSNTHKLVKEHELIDAKKRLDEALPNNPVLKKQKK